MKHCLITVDGVTYDGLFLCTVDAVLAAMELYPAARRISAKVSK